MALVKRNESLKSLKGEKGENALKSDTSDLSDSSDLSDRSDFDNDHLAEVRSLIADDLSPVKSLGEAWL